MDGTIKNASETMLIRDNISYEVFADAIKISWFAAGHLHASDAPAIIQTYSNGFSALYFYINGKRRSNAPRVVSTFNCV